MSESIIRSCGTYYNILAPASSPRLTDVSHRMVRLRCRCSTARCHQQHQQHASSGHVTAEVRASDRQRPEPDVCTGEWCAAIPTESPLLMHTHSATLLPLPHTTSPRTARGTVGDSPAALRRRLRATGPVAAHNRSRSRRALGKCTNAAVRTLLPSSPRFVEHTVHARTTRADWHTTSRGSRARRGCHLWPSMQRPSPCHPSPPCRESGR